MENELEQGLEKYPEKLVHTIRRERVEAYNAGIEAALESLPEEQNKTNYKPPSWNKDKLLQPEFANERIWGWNAYADQVRTAIEAKRR